MGQVNHGNEPSAPATQVRSTNCVGEQAGPMLRSLCCRSSPRVGPIWVGPSNPYGNANTYNVCKTVGNLDAMDTAEEDGGGIYPDIGSRHRGNEELDCDCQKQWSAVDRYLTDLLLPPDPAPETALQGQRCGRLATYPKSPTQGKLLMVLAQAQGARSILEIGTLGGY